MEQTIRRIADELLADFAAEKRAQVRQTQRIAELVDAFSTVSPSLMAAGERLVHSGGDGTPQVAEFVVVEVAAMLQMGSPSAWALIHDVLNLRHRHPRLWAALDRGEVPVWQARKIARRCADTGLSFDAAQLVDTRLESSWGRLPWTRLLRKTEGLIVSADTALAEQRAEQRRADRFVAIHHDGDGSSTLVARMDTADAVCLKRAIDSIANAMVLEGRPEALPQLRSEALAELARPTDRGVLPRPKATLVVHVAREALNAGKSASGEDAQNTDSRMPDDATAHEAVAREDSIGPLLLSQVRDLLTHDRVRLLPVLDLAGDPGADGYEIPDRMRTQLQIREPFSIFPFSTTRSMHADLDHTVPYQAVSKERHGPPEQTRPSNLGPLGRLEHRAKTHGGWALSQPESGTYVWRSPIGYRYRVRNGFTETITRHRSAVAEADVIVVPERDSDFSAPPPDAVLVDAPPDEDDIDLNEHLDHEWVGAA